MPAPIFEEQVICDNCGSVVTSRAVSAAQFKRDFDELDPALPQTDPTGEVLLDEGDLIGVEEERPVEVLLRHVSTCGRCSGSP
jgi:hypothetical protein